jgi:FtsZ-interacting cell division protein ZipA
MLMPVWGWILIAVAVVAIVLVIVARQMSARKQQSSHLRDRFGPEYDRVAGATGSKRDAESELTEREERRDQLAVRPLPDASRERYLEWWRTVQAQFVDDPKGAIGAADQLIQSVMAERGYPVEDFEQRAQDLSVDHPDLVQNYRKGHHLAEASRDNGVSTEDLRQAMTHYKALFVVLVEPESAESRA